MAKAPVPDDDGERIVRRPLVKFTHKIEASHADDDDDDVQPPPRKKTSQPEFEEVEIGGKKYKVEKGGAEALKAQLKPKKPAVSESQQIKQMLDEYTAKLQGGKKKKAAEPDDDDDDDEGLSDDRLFTDTKGWMKDFKKSLSKDILAAISGAYTQDQSQKEFWGDFYRTNSDLKDYDFIVKAVMSKNAAELSPMSTEEGSDRLAELAREQLLNIAKKVSKGKSKNGKFHVEGEQSSRRNDPDDDEDEDDDEKDRKAGIPMTMSALLKDRREKRRLGKPVNRTEEGEE